MKVIAKKDESNPATRHFILQGSNVLANNEGFFFEDSQSAQEALCPIAEILLKTPYFSKITLHSMDGSDCLTISTKPGITWDRQLSTTKSSALEDAIAKKLEKDLFGKRVIGRADVEMDASDNETLEEMKLYLAENVPPVVKSHGGRVEIGDYNEKDKVLRIKFMGRCADHVCEGSKAATQNILSNQMRYEFPDLIKRIDFELIP